MVFSNKTNPFSPGQSIGGGSYKGTPYDSRTGKKIVYSGGRSSSSRASSAQLAESIAKNKAIAAAKAQEASRLKLEEAKAEIEQKRLINLRRDLLAANARKTGVVIKDKEGKVRFQRETIMRNGIKLITETNFKTGEKKVTQYRAGRLTGGVIGIDAGEAPSEPVTFNIGSTKRFNLPNAVRITVEREGLSNSINNIKSSTQLNSILQRDIKLDKPSQILMDVADAVSGGYFTEIKINEDQSNLNNRIIKFNKKFDGKELSESEYNKAISEQGFIERQQKSIDERNNNLIASDKNKLRNFYQTLSIQKSPRLTAKQQDDVIRARASNKKIQADIKRNQPIIRKFQSSINSKNKEISRLQSKTKVSILEYIKMVRLKNQVNFLKNEIAVMKHERPPRIMMGSVPIIPASSIPSGISQVSFIGTQRAGKNGKIITDIVFKTNKGIMGISKSASVAVKGKTVSIVGGRFGKITAKLLKGGRQLKKIKSFVGIEKGVSKSTKFTSDKIRRIAKFISQQKKVGIIRAIKTNVKGMQQAGVGRILTFNGKRIFRPYINFPSGRVASRMARGINIDDFASVSAILTKGDLSAIVGKTITVKGSKSQFIGLIKTLKSSSDSGRVILTTIDKKQYSKAMQKLITSVSAAVSRAEKTGRYATKTLVLAAAATDLSRSVPTVSSLKSQRTTTKAKKIVVKKSQPVVTRGRQIQVQKRGAVGKSKQRQIVKQKKALIDKQKRLSKQVSSQRRKVGQLSKVKSKSKAKQTNKQISRLKQNINHAVKQISRLKIQQKLLTKQVSINRPIVRSGTTKPLIIVPFKLPKGYSSRTLPKKVDTYYVITKKRGKMVKLNPKPLTKRDARDFLAYSIDNNLTKSAWFIPLGKAKSVVRPPKKIQGYYSKVNKKLRPYKIRYGKKKQMIDGYIEKRKYFQDTKGEVTQAKRLRAKSRKRKQVKRRTPVKRKPFKRKTVVRRTPKRKASTKKRVVKRKVVRKVVKRRRNIKRKRR